MNKANEICAAIGAKVMDTLRESAGAPIATMGEEQPDGTYEFLLGPVYLPHEDVSLAAPTETRQLLVNLRLETQERTRPRVTLWLCKRGDDYTQTPQPKESVVIDAVEASPGEDIVVVKYHLSR